jgi:hypothetical protein
MPQRPANRSAKSPVSVCPAGPARAAKATSSMAARSLASRASSVEHMIEA